MNPLKKEGLLRIGLKGSLAAMLGAA